MDAVADFRAAARAGRGRPAIDLTEDPAILTAIANDIGTEAIFSRQVIAYGAAGDALLALSTSGNSRNVIEALARGAPAGAGDDRDGRLRRRRDRRARASPTTSWSRARSTSRGSRRRRRAPTTRCGSSSDERAAPRRARAPAHARAGARHRPGRRLSPLRLPARRRARARAASCSTTPTACCSRSRATAPRSPRFLARLAPDAPPLAVLERVATEEREPTGGAGFAILESPRGGVADAPSRPTARPASSACASSSTPPTAASATRSPTAPTAARASRSSAASPTTAR